MNAPAAGKITEHLANEEDTVTVGQDLFKFEPGAAGDGMCFITVLTIPIRLPLPIKTPLRPMKGISS